MGRRRMRPVINSVKHVVDNNIGTLTTNTVEILAKAVNAPSNTVTTDCHHGSIIKAIWISLDVCGLASGVTRQVHAINLMKNPGANLTEPGVFAVGSSNEKKFIFKQWFFMTMLVSSGNAPFHWEGWIKIPKQYQRMGTDDTLTLTVGCTTQTGHFDYLAIYKEYF